MVSEDEALQNLLRAVETTSDWLLGYCCSYRGPAYGHTLKVLLDDYRKTLDGHGTSDSR